MIRKKVRIDLDTGLEARPLAHVVQLASQYESSIHIEVEDKSVNAKSIMGMMTMGLSKGEEITLTASGEDEEAAITALEGYLSQAN